MSYVTSPGSIVGFCSTVLGGKNIYKSCQLSVGCNRLMAVKMPFVFQNNFLGGLWILLVVWKFVAVN